MFVVLCNGLAKVAGDAAKERNARNIGTVALCMEELVDAARVPGTLDIANAAAGEVGRIRSSIETAIGHLTDYRLRAEELQTLADNRRILLVNKPQ